MKREVTHIIMAGSIFCSFWSFGNVVFLKFKLLCPFFIFEPETSDFFALCLELSNLSFLCVDIFLFFTMGRKKVSMFAFFKKSLSLRVEIKELVPKKNSCIASIELYVRI